MPYGMNMLLWSGDVTGDEYLPLFGRLKKMGFDTVETPIFDADPEKFARLGRRLQDLGLGRTASTALSPERNLISADAKTRRNGVEFLERALDCCQAESASLLIGPVYSAIGVFSGAGPTRDEWNRSVECLKEVSGHAKKAGVTIALEFLNRFEIYLVNCSSDAVRLVRDVDHPNFRMMYDTFHANIEEKSITQAVSGCAEVLAHVHISENDRSTPGKGGVNWDETFAALKKIGYRGSLTIEAFGQGVPALAAATKIWRRMFENEEKVAEEGLAFLKSRWEGS